MLSFDQPLDPAEVDPEIVEHLRALWRQGRSTAELVRALYDRGLHTVPVKMCFEAAFCLDRGDAMAIGGWFPDGTGELSEEQLHSLIAPFIEDNRLKWDQASAQADGHTGSAASGSSSAAGDSGRLTIRAGE